MYMSIHTRLLFSYFLIAWCFCFSQEKEATRVFFDGELLYWKPDQTGMSYCLVSDMLTSSVLGKKNQDRQQHTDWNAGFRIGSGVRVAKVHCDLSTYWTHFSHTMHGSTSTNNFILGTQLFLGSFVPIGGGGVAQIDPGGRGAGPAHSQWKLHVNLIECDFGYQICFDKRFSLHPYLGIKGGWIDQEQTVHYDQFFDSNNQIFFDSAITLKNNFKGIGPQLGMDGDFIFGHGFGLMGNLSAALLYGSSDNPVTFHVENNPLSFPFSDFSVNYQKDRLIPAVQSQIGLNWGKECFQHFIFYLNAAYEVQYFWNTWRNQGSAIQSIAVPDAGYGNLMLHGFTGQVQLAF